VAHFELFKSTGVLGSRKRKYFKPAKHGGLQTTEVIKRLWVISLVGDTKEAGGGH
jgi:hypothetical protein